MQKITPHLWFNTEAREAAEFYVKVFGKNSKITSSSVIHNTPSGSVDVLSFTLWGYEFAAISAGPLFTFNPSISFSVYVASEEEVKTLWEKLSQDGSVLMDLGTYPWSSCYGWTADRFGISWQIMLVETNNLRPVTPHLMFVGEQCGKAEEAIHFYVSVFANARVGEVFRYQKGQEPDAEGTIAHAAFQLEGQEFSAMDSAREHSFSFNEAISLMVHCDSQEEIDTYWNKLSAVPEAEQCGWLKDRFGVSWQIVPRGMNEMLQGGDKEKIDRVTQAFLKMKKFDIEELERAANGM